MNKLIDVREVLPLVRVPTLVLHGDRDQIVPVAVAEQVAQRLRSGRLVVLPGVGHLSLGPEGDRIGDEIERFVADVRASGAWDSAEPDRVLAKVLFTDIVESTNRAIELGDRRWRDVLERHNSLIRRELLRYLDRRWPRRGVGGGDMGVDDTHYWRTTDWN
jgi:fermentation-respiration switch protein FrsA (DUF1100 family)